MKWMKVTPDQQNGDVILTDEGTAKYVDQRDWGSPVTNGWYLCTLHGDIPYCADDGMRISGINPTLWMPIPEFD